MAEWDFDLLGDPIPAGLGKRGRPPHLPTDENRRKIIALMAFDKNEAQIAAALSISVPTLKKHYFRELAAKLEARQRVEGKLLGALMKEVDAGNVSAIDKVFKRLDRHDLARRIQPPTATKPAKAKPLGKKAQAEIDAHDNSGEGRWGSLLN